MGGGEGLKKNANSSLSLLSKKNPRVLFRERSRASRAVARRRNGRCPFSRRDFLLSLSRLEFFRRLFFSILFLIFLLHHLYLILCNLFYVVYPLVVIESAELLADQTVWNQPSLPSVLS